MYAIWFFLYEPINYLNIKNEASLTYDPVWKMKRFMTSPQPYIILGNSQVAHLNTDSLKHYSGKPFENIAFGGASLPESIDQFWWATECGPLKEVWFAVSFYTLNKYYNVNRIERLRKLVKNPFDYMTDPYYISLAYHYMQDDENAEPRMEPVIDPNQKYRDDLIHYAKEVIAGEGCVKYRYDTEAISALAQIGHYCKLHKIKLIFIIPPMQESIFDLAVVPLGLDFYVDRTREDLIKIATVYDWEYINDFTNNQDNFFDGFHLKEGVSSSYYLKSLCRGKSTDFMRIYPIREYSDVNVP